MSDLLKEFQDDLRRERTGKLWERFGRLMVMASIGVVLATVVVVVWKDHSKSTAMKETSRFMLAVERAGSGNTQEAISLLDGFSKGSDYYGPAMLRKAHIQQQSGDSAGARKTYETLAETSGVYADLARTRVSDEVPAKDSVFYYAHSEQAAWRLLEKGKKDEAVAIMRSLSEDIDTPRSQRQRISQIVQHLAPGKQASNAQ